jgi:hypothetical protein
MKKRCNKTQFQSSDSITKVSVIRIKEMKKDKILRRNRKIRQIEKEKIKDWLSLFIN